MNPMLNQLMGFALKNNPIMNMFRTVMTAQNPNAIMQSMAQSNPQLQQTLDYINSNGGNAKQLFYSMAQQKNVDPNIIINNLNTFKG